MQVSYNPSSEVTAYTLTPLQFSSSFETFRLYLLVFIVLVTQTTVSIPKYILPGPTVPGILRSRKYILTDTHVKILVRRNRGPTDQASCELWFLLHRYHHRHTITFHRSIFLLSLPVRPHHTAAAGPDGLQSHANSMEIFTMVDAGALWHFSLFMFTQPLLGCYQ
jgi:hypothetical protein